MATTMPNSIKILRFDITNINLDADADSKVEIVDLSKVGSQHSQPQFQGPFTRISIVETFGLPDDCVIKLMHDGQLVPWSLASSCDPLEIQVFRPHQNVKPQVSAGPSASSSDILVRRKIKELEGRLASLELVADPALISEKSDRDLQLLTKQISFLAKRLEEADKAEWIKKP